jgi:hypothetical protein
LLMFNKHRCFEACPVPDPGSMSKPIVATALQTKEM